VSPAPLAEAAPPTAAATTPSDSHVRAGIEVFAQYAYRVTNALNGPSSSDQRFDVPRVHGAVEGDYGPLFGRVLVEGVRSASEGALAGVAGDSILLRVREAYGAYRLGHVLEVRAGVIPELTIPELDGTWMMRAVSASPQETSNLYVPGDIGASAVAKIPDHWGWVGVAAYNGEGYAQQELNEGKNVELAGEIHPVHMPGLLPLAVFASYTSGSTGTESARANRATAGLLYQGARVRAGVDYSYGWGVGTNGTQDSTITDAFVRVEPVSRLLVGARVSYWLRNANAVGEDTETSVTGTVGWRFGDPLEAFVAVTRAFASTEAQSEDAGSDYTELRFVAHVVF
jgi:hypothetical protein